MENDKILKMLKENYKKMSNNDWKSVLLNAIKKLNDSGKQLSGGNCGMTALALHKYLKETTGKDLEIVILSNVDEEEKLYYEPDIYHVFLYDGEYAYDENGINEVEDMFQIANVQYGNNDAYDYIFKSNEINNLLKIIRNETNWSIDWSIFYRILKS